MPTVTKKPTKPALPKPIVEKSKGAGKTRYFGLQILIEESPGRYGSSNGAKGKSDLSKWIVDYFADVQYDGYYGDWAIKTVVMTEEQFKLAYDAL